MRQGRLILFCIASALFVTSCGAGYYYAPVVSAGVQARPKSGLYEVKPGDTLYSIAWAYGLDYRELAAGNNIKPPYAIQIGQSLNLLSGSADRYSAEVVSARSSASPSSAEKPKSQARWQARYTPKPHTVSHPSSFPIKRVANWIWPAYGKVVSGFSTAPTGNTGINIAGHYGETIRAAAAGIVVYSGAGVRGYGNLIIVKHSDSFLSAYAFNKQLLVKAGERVKAGQKIAEMGRNNAGQVLLHFEIRRNGAPVNPMAYLS